MQLHLNYRLDFSLPLLWVLDLHWNCFSARFRKKNRPLVHQLVIGSVSPVGFCQLFILAFTLQVLLLHIQFPVYTKRIRWNYDRVKLYLQITISLTQPSYSWSCRNDLVLRNYSKQRFIAWMTLPFPARLALIDFALSNARRFYSSMRNPLGRKGLVTERKPIRKYSQFWVDIFRARHPIATLQQCRNIPHMHTRKRIST